MLPHIECAQLFTILHWPSTKYTNSCGSEKRYITSISDSSKEMVVSRHTVSLLGCLEWCTSMAHQEWHWRGHLYRLCAQTRAIRQWIMSEPPAFVAWVLQRWWPRRVSYFPSAKELAVSRSGDISLARSFYLYWISIRIRRGMHLPKIKKWHNWEALLYKHRHIFYCETKCQGISFFPYLGSTTVWPTHLSAVWLTIDEFENMRFSSVNCRDTWSSCELHNVLGMPIIWNFCNCDRVMGGKWLEREGCGDDG